MLAPIPVPRPAFSALEFRAALGMFATGVTIVSTRTPAGELVGLTVNSFNSVSLEPPLVLWSLGQHSMSAPFFQSASHYAVNVLAADQRELALRFAAPVGDRWAGVAWQPGATGAPLIEGTVAHFECRNQSRHDEGDHIIFIGQVVHCDHRAGAAPLLFHGGRFYTELPL